jgi:hypothetical protein
MIVAIWALSIALVLVVVYELAMRAVREARKLRCYGGGALHCFKGRYTVLGAQLDADKMTLFFTDDEYKADVANAMSNRKELYRGDVCVWCGKVVNEQGTPA